MQCLRVRVCGLGYRVELGFWGARLLRFWGYGGLKSVWGFDSLLALRVYHSYTYIPIPVYITTFMVNCNFCTRSILERPLEHSVASACPRACNEVPQSR